MNVFYFFYYVTSFYFQYYSLVLVFFASVQLQDTINIGCKLVFNAHFIYIGKITSSIAVNNKIVVFFLLVLISSVPDPVGSAFN
jgi:hypothetical protein